MMLRLIKIWYIKNNYNRLSIGWFDPLKIRVLTFWAAPLFLRKILLLKTRLFYFIPAILCFLLSFYLLTIPGKELPDIGWLGQFQIDKLVHIYMFFTVCLLFSYPFKSFSKKFSIILFI